MEQFFVLPLLTDLGYGPDYLETKATVEQVVIGKGKQKRLYYPDYLAYARRGKEKPVLVIDAKHPNESAEEGIQDAQLYTSVIRRRMTSPKPEQYCIGVNGNQLVVKHYDSDTPLHILIFTDFVDGNPKFEALRNDLSRQSTIAKLTVQTATQGFEFRKVIPSDLPSIFETCHKKIWKKR